ncbi:MAG TPA: hypothetical protein VMB80_09250 [Candidatus Acidoferrum sp.]|nr:hypothetical protein [Candidatus Acidoferrum sp.]
MAETVFETDDGRTGAGADASNNKLCVFISFFLKPLSVRLPYAARFTCAEALPEVTVISFRRAGGMTGKAVANSRASSVA